MKVIDRDCVARTRAIILQTQLRLPMSCLSCDWPEDLVVVAKLPPKGPQTADCQSPFGSSLARRGCRPNSPRKCSDDNMIHILYTSYGTIPRPNRKLLASLC